MEFKLTGIKGFSRVYDDNGNECMGLAYFPPEEKEKSANNNSVKKCVICNNEKIGEFININDKKYHLCCIEQQQHNWNELKTWLKQQYKLNDLMYYNDRPVTNPKKVRIEYLSKREELTEILNKMKKLEGNNEIYNE